MNFQNNLIIALTFLFIISCKQQYTNRKDNNLTNHVFNKIISKELGNISIVDSINFLINKDKISILIAKNDTLKKSHFIVIKNNKLIIKNDKIIYPKGELGAISNNYDNISLYNENSKIKVIQEFGGSSSNGYYGMIISLKDVIKVDSISYGKKVFLSDEVKIAVKSKFLDLKLTENTDLSKEYESLLK